MARRCAALLLGWLTAWAGLPGCGRAPDDFLPPLLLDTGGLEPAVELDGGGLLAGDAVEADFGDARLRGHVLALAGDTRLRLILSPAGRAGLALYGPRSPQGLFGTALRWNAADAGGAAVLDSEPLPAGDYLVLVADRDGAGAAYRLATECSHGCGPPGCPPLVCGRYCAAGLARDAGGCARCACNAGCSRDADCPLGFACRDELCRAEQPDCDCSAEPYAPVCGDDGVTYANDCERRCAGAGLAAAGPCSTSACNSDADCPSGMRCEAGDCRADCECEDRALAPVCGSDGQTYPNDCERRCAGVGLAHQGACDQCSAEVCGDELDNDCDGYVDEGCEDGCSSDADCSAGRICQGGVCASALPCAADLDCPSGQQCVAGVCRPQQGCAPEVCGNGLDDDCDGLIDEGCPACRSDTDCAPDEVCQLDSGRCQPACQPQPEICNGADDDCDGLIDEDFDLQNDPDNCGACGQACDPGESCQQGRCTPAACASDADCADGQVCIDGACWTACTEDADCPAGHICWSGYCSIPCAADADCPEGWSCNFNQRVCEP